MTAETWSWFPGDPRSFSLHTHVGSKPQPHLPKDGVWCVQTRPCNREEEGQLETYETITYRIINGEHEWGHDLEYYHTWEEAVEGHINTCRDYETM